MVKCLRCGAGAEWVQGNPPRESPDHDREVAELREELSVQHEKVKYLGTKWGESDGAIAHLKTDRDALQKRCGELEKARESAAYILWGIYDCDPLIRDWFRAHYEIIDAVHGRTWEEARAALRPAERGT